MSELYYHKKRNIICRLIPFAVTIQSLATDRQTAPKVLLKFTYLQQSSNAFLKTSLKLAHFVRHLLIVLPPYPLSRNFLEMVMAVMVCHTTLEDLC